MLGVAHKNDPPPNHSELFDPAVERCCIVLTVALQGFPSRSPILSWGQEDTVQSFLVVNFT